MSKSHPNELSVNVLSVIRGSALAGASIAGVITLLAIIALAAAPRASAVSWETVKTFAPLVPQLPNPPEWPEDVQLGGIGGMAINRTGAGGVDPGTIYTVGSSNTTPLHAARYSADGEFELAWTPISRCGPKVVPASTCPTFPSGTNGGIDIAVNQTTGNVYVFNIAGSPFLIREYKADGTGPIAQFGEFDPNGTVTTSPDKVHGSPLNENIAVDDSGTVYVFDEATLTNLFHRVMVFKPQTPGDYEHYVYAGKSSDIAAGFLPSNPPFRPTVDDSGDVYVSGEAYVEKYDPAQPSISICSFKLPTGGIKAAAVDPMSGRVFFFTNKDAKIHQLNPCNAEGKFVEDKTANPPFSVVPQRGNIEALAFNPTRQFSPDGAPGVLYAGTPTNCPGIGACPPEAEGQSALGYMFAPAVSHLPVVEAQSVTQVGPISATLNAKINPKGSQTSYVFQYLTAAAYEANEPAERFAGASEAPLGGAPLGSGQVGLSAAVTLSKLSPGTEYRYRVVATNAEGSTQGSAEAFRTFALEAPGLPNGRAWELVSPVQKNGGEVLPAAPNTASCGGECKPGLAAPRFPTQVTASGDGIAYQGSPFTLNDGPAEFDEYVSTRGSNSWQTRSLGPPLGDNPLFEAFALTPDLGSALLYARNPALTPEAPAGYRNVFAQPGSDRFDLDPLLKTAPLNRAPDGAEGFALNYVGATADFSRVFFEANDALTGETPFAPAALDGGSKKNNLYEWSDGELHLLNVQPGNAETTPGAAFGSGLQLSPTSLERADYSNAISTDGSRVFWSSESGQVYVRVDGETTREIPDPGKFLTASQDGSKVLLSNGHLYDLETETTTDLTQGQGGFLGITGQGDDLSHVYLVDTKVLTGEEENEEGAKAKDGEPNLYAWSEGGLAYVATLSPQDNTTAGITTWEAAPVVRTAEASPDGRWLAFNSLAELTGVDTIGACEYAATILEYVGSVPCAEVFLYDSESGELSCPSCNPVGEHPHGDSFLRIAQNAKGHLEQPRYLTNSGRLYFDSRDSLVLHDTNGKVEDVYQYEPKGVGGCSKEGGCVSLISAGHEAIDSNFLAMDESGRNVFFTTRDQLSLKDKDDLIDLYVAREGGGIPSETETARGECQGEACQPLFSPPNDPTPGSSSFEGAGNVDEKKAAKKHKKKKKKHAKHKHAKKHKRAHGRAAKHNRGGAK
ncbi:MAG: hypothetical protein QOF13_1755 [Solirubrobacterales bacterium]|jgi:hypothetical protein|nr:hypothetical protein [Solirubrobacterales bacterium]